MNRVAIFPGSFDPFTTGHESIVRRGLHLFDKIIIGIGINHTKTGFLKLEKRINIIEKVFFNENRVHIQTYSGLTTDFCKQINCFYILRGLRTTADFEFERAIGQTNKKLLPEIETVFILTHPEHSFISSSIVRDILINGGDADAFLPSNITSKDLFSI